MFGISHMLGVSLCGLYLHNFYSALSYNSNPSFGFSAHPGDPKFNTATIGACENPADLKLIKA